MACITASARVGVAQSDLLALRKTGVQRCRVWLVWFAVDLVRLVNELLIVLSEPRREFRLGCRGRVLWLSAAAHMLYLNGC